jgi:cytochrome d ubiquinol oxidase subunit I
MAVGMIAVAAPLQILAGHVSGEVALEHQPSKLAAIEAYWDTRKAHPLNLVAIPDRAAEKNHFQLAVPGLGVIVAPPDVEVKGLKAFAPEDRPPVFPVFWGFRVMVGLGVLMLVLGVWGVILAIRRRLEANRPFLRFAVAMGPAGFIAVLAGWIVTEVGRQPYLVYGALRTRDAVSPVTQGEVVTSLLTYVIVYAIVFTAGAIYILRILAKGPGAAPEPPAEPRPPGWALAAAPEAVDGEAP